MPDLPKHIEDAISSWGGTPKRCLPTYPQSPVQPAREQGGQEAMGSGVGGGGRAAQYRADSKDFLGDEG